MVRRVDTDLGARRDTIGQECRWLIRGREVLLPSERQNPPCNALPITWKSAHSLHSIGSKTPHLRAFRELWSTSSALQIDAVQSFPAAVISVDSFPENRVPVRCLLVAGHLVEHHPLILVPWSYSLGPWTMEIDMPRETLIHLRIHLQVPFIVPDLAMFLIALEIPRLTGGIGLTNVYVWTVSIIPLASSERALPVGSLWSS